VRADQPHAIGERAVRASYVFEHHQIALAHDARVLSRNLRIADGDVVVRVASYGERVFTQYEGLTRLGPLVYHQPGIISHFYLLASFVLDVVLSYSIVLLCLLVNRSLCGA
jgi:hypothetical protein